MWLLVKTKSAKSHIHLARLYGLSRESGKFCYGDKFIPLQLQRVHDGKGSWKDTLTEVMAFIDMYDVKLDSGAFLPMEEYGIKWRMYRLDET